MVNKRLLGDRLHALRLAFERLAGLRSELERLSRDPQLQEAVVVNLRDGLRLSGDVASHIIAELDVGKPATTAEAFTLLEQAGVLAPATGEALRRLAGLRNMADHADAEIDWAVTEAVLRDDLNALGQFALQALSWAEQRDLLA
jgi:uncharacterized protein YutE (UPF0331/DUF86 family)